MAERVGQGGPMDERVGAAANGSGSTWTPAAPCDNTGDNSVAPGQKTQSIDNRSSVQSVNTGATAADAVATVKPLQIRGRFFTAVALRMAGEADQAFFDALDEHLRRMPHFFDHAPFVLDLEQAEGLGSADELIALIKALQRRNLSLFGVQNGTPQQVAAAARAGLIALSGGREAPLEEETERLVAGHRGFGERADTLLHDAVIGAARAKAIGGRRGDPLHRRRQSRQFRQQRVILLQTCP